LHAFKYSLLHSQELQSVQEPIDSFSDHQILPEEFQELQQRYEVLSKEFQELQQRYEVLSKEFQELQQRYEVLSKELQELQETRAVKLARKLKEFPFLMKLADKGYKLMAGIYNLFRIRKSRNVI